MFWVAFSGLPRRLHDYPLIYLGWQSLSTVGHFISMIGVFCFYITLIESSFERKLHILNYNLIPRFYVNYSIYNYKLINNNYNLKNYNSFNLNKKAKNYIIKHI